MNIEPIPAFDTPTPQKLENIKPEKRRPVAPVARITKKAKVVTPRTVHPIPKVQVTSPPPRHTYDDKLPIQHPAPEWQLKKRWYLKELGQFKDVEKLYKETTQKKKGFLHKHRMQDPARPGQILGLGSAIGITIDSLKLAKNDQEINRAIKTLNEVVQGIKEEIKPATLKKGTSRLVNVINKLEKAIGMEPSPPVKPSKHKKFK